MSNMFKARCFRCGGELALEAGDEPGEVTWGECAACKACATCCRCTVEEKAQAKTAQRVQQTDALEVSSFVCYAQNGHGCNCPTCAKAMATLGSHVQEIKIGQGRCRECAGPMKLEPGRDLCGWCEAKKVPVPPLELGNIRAFLEGKLKEPGSIWWDSTKELEWVRRQFPLATHVRVRLQPDGSIAREISCDGVLWERPQKLQPARWNLDTSEALPCTCVACRWARNGKKSTALLPDGSVATFPPGAVWVQEALPNGTVKFIVAMGTCCLTEVRAKAITVRVREQG